MKPSSPPFRRLRKKGRKYTKRSERKNIWADAGVIKALDRLTDSVK